ncbi:aspartate/glutamate racemase family protein [Ramlibacter sp. XY19]|uniref:aspartate/glutamate racemase family protein n=1 Tax=Ramlibacter paludis TaxID=2908000 RepID=UPI0023DAA04B|nr:aspartate/glutamate racemase family protein [Ramlibacter paludis]MCG2593074.1 aspartate/glutamate racemase family protein [Ramlibacter paludis]
MLDTRFPRPLGDIGNPASWPIPTLLKVVPRLAPGVVVQSAAGLRASGVLPQLQAALLALEEAGCEVLTTSCGFLVLLQQELQAALKVPLVSSSLLQLPALLARERRVGVLTISAAHLGEEHLLAAGVPRERLGDVVVQGVDPQGEFARPILGNDTRMDLEQAGADVAAAAVELKRRAPDLRTVVLECTNMPPYAQQLAEATGLRPLSLRDSIIVP